MEFSFSRFTGLLWYTPTLKVFSSKFCLDRNYLTGGAEGKIHPFYIINPLRGNEDNIVDNKLLTANHIWSLNINPRFLLLTQLIEKRSNIFWRGQIPMRDWYQNNRAISEYIQQDFVFESSVLFQLISIMKKAKKIY